MKHGHMRPVPAQEAGTAHAPHGWASCHHCPPGRTTPCIAETGSTDFLSLRTAQCRGAVVGCATHPFPGSHRVALPLSAPYQAPQHVTCPATLASPIPTYCCCPGLGLLVYYADVLGLDESRSVGGAYGSSDLSSTEAGIRAAVLVFLGV